MREAAVRLFGWAMGLLLLAGSLLLSGPASAQADGDPIDAIGPELVALLNDAKPADQVFGAEFLQQVPPAQVEAIAASLREQFGAALRATVANKQDARNGTIKVTYERGSAMMKAALGAMPPHRVQGLLITGTERADDTFEALGAEVRALPGSAGFSVARLGDGAPESIASSEPGKPLAIGSAFKLFVLAELSRQVRAGERRWSDVVPLSHKSLPSGFLQAWPAGSPLTLHSLAALMISQSDNSATDTLLHLAGRERVEALLPGLGLGDDSRNRPFLSTLEAFTLKGGDQAVTARWLAAGEAARRRLLGEIATADPARIDPARLSARPNHIDKIEWFASPEGLVRALDWLRRSGDEQALAIFAINPGLPRPANADFAYQGFKGGSETGVIAMAFLVRTKAGAWYAVAGAWNDPKAAVDEQRFALLMNRALALLPD